MSAEIAAEAQQVEELSQQLEDLVSAARARPKDDREALYREVDGLSKQIRLKNLSIQQKVETLERELTLYDADALAPEDPHEARKRRQEGGE